jgi:uncharacterized protein YlxW (UPF0749 family)
VVVGGRRIAGPYVVTAIWDPETLEGALRLPLGVMETLSSCGIKVEAQRDPDVLVPGLGVRPTFRWAVSELGAADGAR